MVVVASWLIDTYEDDVAVSPRDVLRVGAISVGGVVFTAQTPDSDGSE